MKNVSLKGECINSTGVIETKSRSDLAPCVLRMITIQGGGIVTFESFGINPERGVVINFSAITCTQKTILKAAATGSQQGSLRVRGLLGDDINHTVDRINAPGCRAGSANYFDAFDIFQQRILLLPQNAGKHRRIYATSVHQNLQFVR